MANNPMKRCSASLAIRKMEMKAAVEMSPHTYQNSELNPGNTKYWEERRGAGTFTHFLIGMQSGTVTAQEQFWRFVIKHNVYLTILPIVWTQHIFIHQLDIQVFSLFSCQNMKFVYKFLHEHVFISLGYITYMPISRTAG